MAFNGSGVFNRIYSWVSDAANNIPITASRMDTEDSGFAAGLSNCITKDGQQVITAHIPFNGFRITGLGDPAASQDAVTLNTLTSPTNTTAPQFNKQTAAEIAGSAVPTLWSATPGWAIRYTNGITDAMNQQANNGAPVVGTTGGMSIRGPLGGGPRPTTTLLLQQVNDGDHTIISLMNNFKADEAAIETLGVLSDSSVVQQGAMFTRFLNSVNTVGSYEVVFGHHLVGSGGTGDQIPLMYWSRNSVRLLGGLTAGSPWNSPPPANWLWVSGSQIADTALVVGAGHAYSTATNYNFEVNGRAQIGDVDGSGVTDHATQIGYISGSNTIQSFRNSTSAYSPLTVRSSQTIFDTGNVEPSGNGTLKLGSAVAAWSDIYAVNALHVTSDQRKKEDAGAFTDADRALATRLKGMVRKYRWKAGPDDKIHIGLYAQEVEQAAIECGVLIHDLAFLDKTDDTYSLVYTELLLYILAAS